MRLTRIPENLNLSCEEDKDDEHCGNKPAKEV